VRVRVDHYIDEEFIIQMIALFISGDSASKSKRDFMSYLRDQISMFGSDYTSQFGETERDTRDATILYRKWFG
jgi:hypothetical protein